MPLKPLPSNSCRFEGCTLTGALSVTTSLKDCVSIVHGPAGCAHHNFSLLHTISLDHGSVRMPRIATSGMLDTEIVFGGEDALRGAIRGAVKQDASFVCVISSCVAETIGDDVNAVCHENWSIPVIPIPASGFLGGSFQKGVNHALQALAGIAPIHESGGLRGGINIIGEKNLEFDVEENYAEVARLLALLDLTVNVRFVHEIGTSEMGRLGCASLNILRDEGMESVGDVLSKKYSIPSLSSFPEGLFGTRIFLERVSSLCGLKDPSGALEGEKENQKNLMDGFSDISGSCIAPDSFCGVTPDNPAIREVIALLDLTVQPDGTRVPFPSAAPVGTSGIKRMLHRWRRALHA